MPRLLTLTIATLAPLLLVAPVQAGGKKHQENVLSIHIETDPTDHPKMIFKQFVAGKERSFKRIPEITGKDIAAFHPFPSRDGEGFGVTLQLKARASNRFATTTTANQRRWVLTQINGRMVDAVLVDRPVNDGIWIIYKGVTAAEVASFDAEVPRLGAPKTKE